MTPAACALLVRSFGNRSSGFLTGLDRQVAKNEELFQFFLTDLCRYVGIRMQYDGRFQGVTYQLLLARLLDRLPDDASQLQQFGYLSGSLGRPRSCLRKFLQMDRTL